MLRPCQHSARILVHARPLLLLYTTWVMRCASLHLAGSGKVFTTGLQDHLIMALPSSSTLCLVLVLMPTAHSVSCTPMLMSSPS